MKTKIAAPLLSVLLLSSGVQIVAIFNMPLKSSVGVVSLAEVRELPANLLVFT